ncbi:MAG: hypothetical protein ACREU3_12810 [Steroidobacteraceae bacterium]
MASPPDGTAWTRVRPAARPLRALDDTTVRRRLAAAIAAGDGKAGAHCIHELWMRAELAVDIDAELERLWARTARSIPEWLPMRHIDWLSIAYDVAASFRSRRRGKSNVYLVLLDYHDRRNGPYGVYVGMSDYPPAQRFDQHKQGIRASGSVLKRGLEVLAGPTLHLQRISRSEAARIEAELAVALADAGLIVEGGH